MSMPIRAGGVSSFAEFCAAARVLVGWWRGMRLMAPEKDVGDLSWTLWLDPGTHTGLAALVCYRPPLVLDGGREWVAHQLAAQQLHRWAAKAGDSRLGQGWNSRPDMGWAAVGALVPLSYGEMLSGPEVGQAMAAAARVRSLGACWAGSPEWGYDEHEGWDLCGLGPAGVGTELFVNLRADRGRDYLSPVRVRSMFDYAVADEFGIEMLGQTAGDAKTTFTEHTIGQAGVQHFVSDHIRDAMSHALLSVRKTSVS